jgi:beta-phosphoglucomutase-like phosphatase (HAD superfamily)
MDIIGALKQEASRLEQQLTAVQGAIAALNGTAKTAVSLGHASSQRGTKTRRTLSAAGRARMSRAAKARWAKIKAEQSKGKKAK